MIELKNTEELDLMRQAGRVVAAALARVRDTAQVGTMLMELNEVAAMVISEAGAKPSFLHYHPSWAPTPYPAVICASVNDAIVHGIPTGYRLREGDLVSIDCGAYISGWHGDAAISFIVGEGRPEDYVLIETTEAALRAGISAAQVGNRIGDVGHAIESVGRHRRYGILADHGGHGVGRAMHEDPSVPNTGRPGRGLRLRAGMVVALEPMFLQGGRDDYRIADDGWTICTSDGSRAAHVEHTIAITEEGPKILTAL